MKAPLQVRNVHDVARTDNSRTVAQKQVLADNRPEAVAQRKLAEMMNNSPRVLQQRALSDAIHNSPRMMAQRHEMNALFGGAVKPQGDGEKPAEASLAQREEKTNKTGLPNQLKSGIESLSDMSMDHVTVHYNSDKPAQLHAHAYAQGIEIHLGAGQERHLPHEAWHVVQQAQGRVRPTLQMKAGAVNDDPSLEKEADMMGAKALQINAVSSSRKPLMSKQSMAENAPVQRLLNVEGTEYSTLASFKQSGAYSTVFEWLKTEDRAIGKKGYNATLGQYVSSEHIEKFHSLDHFKQNILYDLRQGTWGKDSNASAMLRFMTRRGWKNAALNKGVIVDIHAKQAISLYRTMPLSEAKAIMIDKDISKLSGHMGDYAAALAYCHRATNNRILVEFQLKPGAHQKLFSKEKLAVVAGGETTGYIRDRYETADSKFSTASSGEGIHAEKVGAKSEVHGVAGFSLAAHGAVASNVLKPLIESIRPLLIGKENAAPVPISKSDFVKGYSD